MSQGAVAPKKTTTTAVVASFQGKSVNVSIALQIENVCVFWTGFATWSCYPAEKYNIVVVIRVDDVTVWDS